MRERIRSEKGFSMAELLIVVGLLCLLFAITVPSVTRWQSRSAFVQNNQTARTLYSSLQADMNTLDFRKEETAALLESWSLDGDGICGRLDSYLYSFRFDPVTVEGRQGKLTGEGEQYSSATPEKIYREIYDGYQGGEDPAALYYLKGDAADWQAYCNGTLGADHSAAETAKLTFLYDLFSSHMPEDDLGLLDGSVCLEFAPGAGLVYSVFFSSGAESLTYMSGQSGCLLDRREESRRKDTALTGYYGVRHLSMEPTPEMTAPSITHLRLENGDSLNLHFALSTKGLENSLDYHISLQDAKTDELLRVVTIRQSGINPLFAEPFTYLQKLGSDGTSTSACLIDCEVCPVSDGAADSGNAVTMTFPAWIDAEGGIDLLLDAMDLNAASQSYAEAYRAYLEGKTRPAFLQDNPDPIPTELANSFSITRLGLEEHEEIYASVYAYGSSYRASETVRSNSAHIFFGEEDTTDTTDASLSASASLGGKLCPVKNARHLYNIRFEEIRAGIDAAPRTYQLTGEIVWKPAAAAQTDRIYGPDAELFRKLLENSGSAYTSTAAALRQSVGTSAAISAEVLLKKDADGSVSFPSLPMLHTASVMTGKAGNGGQALIRDLRLTAETNRYRQTACADGQSAFADGTYQTDGTGLFRLMAGSLSDLTLEDALVRGEAYTGSFAGCNAGSMTNLRLTVQKGASVTGTRYTGGIYGGPASDTLREGAGKTIAAGTQSTKLLQAADLLNEAAVTGTFFVGGITGAVVADPAHTGQKLLGCVNTGSITPSDSESAYLGGIAGLVVNTRGNEGQAALYNCYNRQFSEQTLASLTEEALQGSFIGGIAGLVSGGELAWDGSLTEAAAFAGTNTADQDAADSLLVGDRFVGGICGAAWDSSVTDMSGAGEQKASLAGHAYTGGICGSLASLCLADEAGEVTAEALLTDGMTVEDRLTSVLPDRILPSPEPAEGTAAAQAELLKASGRTVSSGEPDPTVWGAIVSGWTNSGSVWTADRFGGGLVGYSTGLVTGCRSMQTGEDTNLPDFLLAGRGIGGLTGFQNGTLDLTASTAEAPAVSGFVTGRSEVGGITGICGKEGRILGGRVGELTVTARECFAGGLAGSLYSAAQCKTWLEEGLSGSAGKKEIAARFCAGGLIGAAWLADPQAEGAASMQIDAALLSAESTGSVSAEACAGGLIAYLAVGKEETDQETEALAGELAALSSYKDASGGRNTLLTLLINADPASFGGERAGELAEMTSPALVLTTASGGQAKALRNTSNSQMTGSADVSAAFLAGGLLGCHSGSVIELSGIRQKQTRSVQVTDTIPCAELGFDSLPQAMAASACSLAGGLVGLADPAMILTDCVIDQGQVIASASDLAGGLCEVNLGRIRDCAPSDMELADRDGVGGLCGINAGLISGAHASGISVHGRSLTGGLTALNLGRILTDQELQLAVTAEKSTAGGLCALMADGLLTGSAEHALAGTVTAQETAGGLCGQLTGGRLESIAAGNTITAGEGYAGGLIAVCGLPGQTEELSVSSCSFTGTVTSKKGDAGGLAGYLAEGGLLTENIVKNAAIAAKRYAGGAVGENAGRMAMISVENPTVSNSDNADEDSAVGGLAGYNAETGELDLSGLQDYQVTVTAAATGSSLGGVCGSNYGSIFGSASVAGEESSGSSTDLEKIRLAASGSMQYANIGGVAGFNDGDIRAIRVSGEICAESLRNLSGHLEYGLGGIAGHNEDSISGCAFSGSLRMVGSSGLYANLGGIAGRNGRTGSISSCVVGDTGVTNLILSSGGNVGGYIGWNQGSMDNPEPALYTQAKVTIQAARGYLGGLVGALAPYASLDLKSCEMPELYSLELTGSGAAGAFIGLIGTDEELGLKKDCSNTVLPMNPENLISRASVTASAGMGGGIIGRIMTGKVELTDLINLGTVKAGLASGIVACSDSADTIFTRCRNYGTITRSGSYGMSEYKSSTAAAMLAGGSYKTLTDCLDLTCGYLIGSGVSGGAVTRSYFFGTFDSNLDILIAWITGRWGDRAGYPLVIVKTSNGTYRLWSYQSKSGQDNPLYRIGIPDTDHDEWYAEKKQVANGLARYEYLETPIKAGGETLLEIYYRSAENGDDGTDDGETQSDTASPSNADRS